jgi:N-methylhydantoinase A/oxoprolinase/acetone carboxylase beta subunit
VRRSAEAVLAAAFDHDGMPADTVASRPVQRALDRRSTTARAVALLSVRLDLPLVALGASAPTYYPAVAALAGTDAVVPEHAGVANAIGAVVGRVRISHVCTIVSPEQGQFLLHAGEQPEVFVSLDDARSKATAVLWARLAADMAAAGAPVFETAHDWAEVTVEVGGMPMFVEGTVTVTGSGRPVVGA